MIGKRDLGVENDKVEEEKDDDRELSRNQFDRCEL